MKILLILFAVFFFNSAVAPVRIEASAQSWTGSRRQSAENSLVKITRLSQSGGSRGSGMYINHKQNYYVLTNSHVCIDRTKDKLDEDNFYFTLSFNSSFEQREGEEYTYQDMILDTEYDICLIPLKFKPASSYDLNLAKTYPAIGSFGFPNMQAITEYYTHYEEFLDAIADFGLMRAMSDIVKQDNNEAVTMTYNGSRFINNRYSFVGHFIENMFDAKVGLASSSNQSIIHPYSLKYTFPSISGDSGSPVFDTNYNLIGVIFAQSRDSRGQLTGLVVPIYAAFNLINNASHQNQ